MAGQVYTMVDTPSSSASIQPGHPPSTMSAWILDVPDGSTQRQVVQQFIIDNNFPLGSIVHIVDVAAGNKYSIGVTLTPAP